MTVCSGRWVSVSGGARETGIERRQVTEIPPVKSEVTEHQMIEMESGIRQSRSCGLK
jgi:hypothetical protein